MLQKTLSPLAELADPKALLFDLDGTLLDTAPDMIGALNALRAENNLPAIDSAPLRQFVSRGSIGMLDAGMPAANETQRKVWQARFLQLYSQDLSRRTVLFPAMAEILDHAAACRIPVAIVTNKPGWLTDPLLEDLQLTQRFGCVVSGDTLAQRKPDPEPVLFACEKLDVAPSTAWFFGDDERDIVAGRAANTVTVAAAYGYIPPGAVPGDWSADAIITEPQQLLARLQQ